MSVSKAELEVCWLLREANGEACQLRASGGSFLEESEGGGGGSSRSFQARDWMPDRAGPARSRLRRAWVAFQGLTLDEQATLRHRFGPRGPMQPVAPGFGEWTMVGEWLPQVQKRAHVGKMTPHEALREMAKKAQDASLLEQCKALVAGALERYAGELAAFDAASEEQRMRDRERTQAIRDGRAAS